MSKAHSILFVRPDYHCSFIYRDSFRRAGWQADVFVPLTYPENLLYSNHDIIRPVQIITGTSKIALILNHVSLIFCWLIVFWRYKFHVYYGRPPLVSFLESRIGLCKLFGDGFSIELWLSRLLRRKLIFLPTGCHDEESKSVFSLLDDGNVCNNCGAWNSCDDSKNNLNFVRIHRYFDCVIGTGTIDSTQFPMQHIRYKAIDLEKWHPDIEVPSEHVLPTTKNIRVLHSAYLSKSNRSWQGRNIKGSPSIISAIKRLKNEGYAIDYFFIHNKPSNVMRFYQAQADIVVDQLIYGWWGSTFVETSALGKPVVCYLRNSWKTFFFKVFPEYRTLPVIEANTSTIYSVLKELVENEDLRRIKGIESRQFAELHFNPDQNTRDFIRLLESL